MPVLKSSRRPFGSHIFRMYGALRRHRTRLAGDRHYMKSLKIYILLGTGGVQGQVKRQRLMGIKAVNYSIGLATCQSKIYKK